MYVTVGLYHDELRTAIIAGTTSGFAVLINGLFYCRVCNGPYLNRFYGYPLSMDDLLVTELVNSLQLAEFLIGHKTDKSHVC